MFAAAAAAAEEECNNGLFSSSDAANKPVKDAEAGAQHGATRQGDNAAQRKTAGQLAMALVDGEAFQGAPQNKNALHLHHRIPS